jgi:hypothetical protein
LEEQLAIPPPPLPTTSAAADETTNTNSADTMQLKEDEKEAPSVSVLPTSVTRSEQSQTTPMPLQKAHSLLEQIELALSTPPGQPLAISTLPASSVDKPASLLSAFDAVADTANASEDNFSECDAAQSDTHVDGEGKEQGTAGSRCLEQESCEYCFTNELN